MMDSVKPILSIAGRRALVIGGTSGIGREIALALAREGADTAATGRREAEAAEACAAIQALGVRSFCHPCDATEADGLSSLRRRVQEEFGGLDILVYAAGITWKAPSAELALEDWRRVMAVNADAALASCQAFHPLLKESSCARIVAIASLSSFLAFHQVAAYSASKAALLSLVQSLACEWASDGIRVNAIVPGVFVTDLNRELLNGTERGHELLMRTPMGRFGEIGELAGAAVFLAGDGASFITGAALPVDGGFLASGVNR
jgi:NAD(P)-dependent dehydrogenase (short-subunit alcohol dehydrogenase family)